MVLEAAGTEQGGVDGLGARRGGEEEDWAGGVGLETVELHQQLAQDAAGRDARKGI